MRTEKAKVPILYGLVKVWTQIQVKLYDDTSTDRLCLETLPIMAELKQSCREEAVEKKKNKDMLL